MAEMALVKIQGVLVAGNDETNERLTRLKAGDVLRGDFKKARNPKFHRKFFALLDIGYDSWEPGELDTKLGVPEKYKWCVVPTIPMVFKGQSSLYWNSSL